MMTKIVKIDLLDDDQLVELSQVTFDLFSKLLITKRLHEGSPNRRVSEPLAPQLLHIQYREGQP